jgi:hypothetical protein
VINMASNVALMGVAGRDCYTAAQGGIAAITRSMAVEFAPQRVRVNAIAPSATMTDRVRGRLEPGNPRVTKLAAAHLVGLIEPEDIANMAVFFGFGDRGLAKDCRLDPRSPQVLGTIALHGKRAAVASIRAMPAAAEAGHPLIATAAFWVAAWLYQARGRRLDQGHARGCRGGFAGLGEAHQSRCLRLTANRLDCFAAGGWIG